MASFYVVRQGRKVSEERKGDDDRSVPLVSPAASATIFLLLFGTLAFKLLDSLTWTDALFASTGVVTTVGVVVRPGGSLSRAFVALLNFVSMGTGAIAVAEVAEAHVRRQLGPGAGAGAGSGVGAELRALLGAAVPLTLGGAAFFAWSEGWAPTTALYFAFTASTGLGFTDGLELRYSRSRLAFVPFIFANMGVTVSVLGIVGVWLREWSRRQLHRTGTAARPTISLAVSIDI